MERVETFPEGVAFWQDRSRLTVLLLVPFYSFYPRHETKRAGCPIGLELIASELVAKGFNVVFVDACMAGYEQLTPQADGTVRYGLTDEQLANVLNRFNPQVVGITSLFSNQHINVEAVARAVRQSYPSALIVEGGSHATGDVDEVLKSEVVDLVVRDEGLITFSELCASVENRPSTSTPTLIRGTSYKDCNREIVHNPSRQFVPTLDILAPRRLEIALHPMYDTPEHTGGSRFHKSGRHAYILSSAGCPLRCEFCHIHTMAGGIRYYSLERFETEVARLKAAGVNELIVEDDMLFADMPRALQVARILKKYDMAWFEEGGLSMFKFMKPGHGLSFRQVLDALAACGCYRFYMAIESANKISLQNSNKPHINTEADTAEEIVKYCVEVGIQAVGGFMLGFKGVQDEYEETLEDMKRTVAYAKRLKDAGLAYVMLFIFTAIPGTAVYKRLHAAFPELDLRTSHERAAFQVGGLTAAELTVLRLYWMGYANGDSCVKIATRTRNWGL